MPEGAPTADDFAERERSEAATLRHLARLEEERDAAVARLAEVEADRDNLVRERSDLERRIDAVRQEAEVARTELGKARGDLRQFRADEAGRHERLCEAVKATVETLGARLSSDLQSIKDRLETLESGPKKGRN